MAHKIVCWRPMYDPSGHDLLRATGADVEIVDQPPREQLIVPDDTDLTAA